MKYWKKAPSRSLLALGLAGGLFVAVAAVRAQMSLPPSLRGPEIHGPDTAKLTRGQEVYVYADCHYCHGSTLKNARGGGVNLAYSRLVQNDVDGDMIGPVVKAGILRTQTAMPTFATMSDSEMSDMAAYIHYMRQVLHEAEAANAKAAQGDATAGSAFFMANCAACHSGRTELAPRIASLDEAALRQAILRPAPARADAAGDAPGRREHLRLLEAYTPKDVADLMAYLQVSKGRLSTAQARAQAPKPLSIAVRFEQNCSMCHGEGGRGGDRGPALAHNPEVKALGMAGIEAAIENGMPGGMPAFKVGAKERADYARYLLHLN